MDALLKPLYQHPTLGNIGAWRLMCALSQCLTVTRPDTKNPPSCCRGT